MTGGENAMKKQGKEKKNDGGTYLYDVVPTTFPGESIAQSPESIKCW